MASLSHNDQSVSDDEYASEDDNLLAELEHDLLGVQNFHFKKDRVQLAEDLTTVNFNRSGGGLCNFRDGNILGKHSGIKFPQKFTNAERIRTGIYLSRDTPLGDVSCVPIPRFVDSRFTDSDARLRETYETRRNECWVVPRELGPLLTIDFKKKAWALSKNYKELCGEAWPKFVMVATAYMPSGESVSVVSPEFEVRSKEQSDKQAAARGLVNPRKRKRRRTAETEACEIKLRAVGANIVQKRSEIQDAKRMYAEHILCYEFLCKILQTCGSETVTSLANKCAHQQSQIAKWDIE
tara:strand:+ start:385 stop:1269 length:885 start_codon:yes stop_codon:yes gene_type:complete